MEFFREKWDAEDPDDISVSVSGIPIQWKYQRRKYKMCQGYETAININWRVGSVYGSDAAYDNDMHRRKGIAMTDKVYEETLDKFFEELHNQVCRKHTKELEKRGVPVSVTAEAPRKRQKRD